MDRRKINRRLPNHFGSIRFLGEGRKNAYAVHMPAIATTFRSAGVDEGASTTSVDKGAATSGSTVVVDKGAGKTIDTVGVGDGAATDSATTSVDISRKTICYTSTWEEGYQVLVLYHAGVITGNEPAEEMAVFIELSSLSQT